MSHRAWSMLCIVAVALALPVTSAQAADDCQCNCYFGFDCNTGDFCDWGKSFTIQDGCWWRTPKPNGTPGNGCDEDYGTYGQCDGKCAPLGLVGGSVAGGESLASLAEGMSGWVDAFNEASMFGGGVPTARAIDEVQGLDFENDTMAYGLWRMATELMILARGPEYIVFPKSDEFMVWDVAVANLRGQPALYRNGNVALAVLVQEMQQAGAGRLLMARIDTDVLDPAFLDLLCGEQDPRDCLYQRIADMATVLRAGAAATGFKGKGDPPPPIEPPCPGCYADVVPNDEVDLHDLLLVLSDWGQAGSTGDVDVSGLVGTEDLLAVLSLWGPCAP